MIKDFLTYKENERRPLSKKAWLLLIPVDLVIIIAVIQLVFLLGYNQIVNFDFAKGLALSLGICCTPGFYVHRRPRPQNAEDGDKKPLNINTALILYAVFMIINILLCIFLYPIKIEYIVVGDFFEFFKPCITLFLCIFTEDALRKADVKDGFRWLFAVSFVIPLIAVPIVTYIL